MQVIAVSLSSKKKKKEERKKMKVLGLFGVIISKET